MKEIWSVFKQGLIFNLGSVISQHGQHQFRQNGSSTALRWRHNGHDSVSNHQPHGCLLNRLFRRRSKRKSKLRVTGLCVGIHRGPVNSPHKWPVTWKMFPFDDIIMGCWQANIWTNFDWSSYGKSLVTFQEANKWKCPIEKIYAKYLYQMFSTFIRKIKKSNFIGDRFNNISWNIWAFTGSHCFQCLQHT